MRLRRARGIDLPTLARAAKVADLPPARLQSAGRYLGTSLVDGDVRVTSQGLAPRSMARISLSDEGLDVIRLAGSFRIPVGDLRSGRTSPDFQGQRLAAPGALVVRWEHGEHVLDTGFRLESAKSIKGLKKPQEHPEKQLTELHRDWARTIGKIARQK
ncbi:MAG: hypothetical protein JWR35_1283 [Marmoricola sp.]|nr:hypothetical protein [Marmoricola sp.]